jgi:hypothetical protein
MREHRQELVFAAIIHVLDVAVDADQAATCTPAVTLPVQAVESDVADDAPRGDVGGAMAAGVRDSRCSYADRQRVRRGAQTSRKIHTRSYATGHDERHGPR